MPSRYSGRPLSLCLVYAADRHLAEDVVQETFARAWKSWAELRDVALAKRGSSPSCETSSARSFSRNKPALDIDAVGEAELPALLHSSRSSKRRSSLTCCRDLRREAAAPAGVGGFSCAEIAGMLGTTEGAVMTRLTRARQALRQLFVAPAARKAAG